MIRFTWLQFRLQSIIAAATLVVLAIVMVVTHPHVMDVYNSTVVTCKVHYDCSNASTVFLKTDIAVYTVISLLLMIAPVLIGMFWGAPMLAREFESGTVRLLWTQGVTRTRWLAVKLGTGLAVTVLSIGLVSLALTWWASKLDLVRADIYNTLLFSSRDLTPVAYAAFAFVLGSTTGLLIRRTLPAMFVTLVSFVAMREIVIDYVRRLLVAPATTLITIHANSVLGFNETPSGIQLTGRTKGLLSNAIVYSDQVVDSSGHAPSSALLNAACPFNKSTGQFNAAKCMANFSAKLHQLVVYQPASHYWPLQWSESGLFLGLAVILGVTCFWLVRRPLS